MEIKQPLLLDSFTEKEPLVIAFADVLAGLEILTFFASQQNNLPEHYQRLLSIVASISYEVRTYYHQYLSKQMYKDLHPIYRPLALPKASIDSVESVISLVSLKILQLETLISLSLNEYIDLISENDGNFMMLVHDQISKLSILHQRLHNR